MKRGLKNSKLPFGSFYDKFRVCHNQNGCQVSKFMQLVALQFRQYKQQSKLKNYNFDSF